MPNYLLDEWPADCPYCGEPITLLIDDSAGDQSLIEDCTVCCRPIVVEIQVDSVDGLDVTVRSEDE